MKGWFLIGIALLAIGAAMLFSIGYFGVGNPTAGEAREAYAGAVLASIGLIIELAFVVSKFIRR